MENNLLGKTIVHPGIGDEVTYVQTAHETSGEKTVLDLKLQPRGGNELHYHKTFDETFEVQEGELMVQVGEEKIRLKQGGETTAKRTELHRFYSESDQPTLFRIIIRPGHEGFESTMTIAYGIASDGGANKIGIPKNFRHMAILLTLGETSLPGFLSMIGKLLKRIAKSKKSIKIQEELINKYCQ